ncbi:heme ABC transporter ATP-binding protein [Paenibacillus prosopidis]|uniref:Iron complex transport system ATP-binding protein n=1 Tax=Paenibacillus prosopidis TaxID=630520 RepID=A0A368W9V1_9BACL|nr:heme ABC transporter ATP-binding protein [Paenibacillus prosopidis]RCW50306.1 iron complex transport system ATP-binding protein [Paenibacillus prosopidis]
MIEARGIVQSVEGRPVLNNLSCSFQKGRMYGIIGPNGVGKSTLLHLLSGVEQPKQGEVLLNGRSIYSFPRKQLARQMAVLQQSGLPPVGFSVREVVSMGRYPFQNWLGNEEHDSETTIDEALTAMGLRELEHRKMDQLSGGERQRVALAKLMAQEPSIILLDEPTTYLDIGFQVQLLDTVRAWQRERKLTVIAVLHDLNLASLYCDELVVLHRGTVAAAGTPQAVLTSALIEQVYETVTAVIEHPLTGTPQIMLQPNSNK